VNSWTFLRNDNDAELFGADTNTPGLGAPNGKAPNTLSASAIVGTWGGDIALEIGEVARISGSAAWQGSGDGSPGLRFGLFNSDGSLNNGSPGYLVFLGNDTDNTFDRTTTASTAGLVFSPLGGQNLNATVHDEQGTWQDDVFNPFRIEAERTGPDSVEIRFLMSGQSGDPVNINAVATHTAANGGVAARTFNFNTFGMQFGATASSAPDSAVFFDVNIAVSLPGDFNFDGSVDAADYVLWRSTVGEVGTGLAADGNGNNVIDAGDYDVWRNNFGAQSAAASVAIAIVPEAPTRIFLCLALAGAYAAYAPRRGGCD
jgi:hypothetical protein